MSLLRPGNILSLTLAGGTVLAGAGVGLLMLSSGGEPDLSEFVSIPPPLPEADVESIVLDPPPFEVYAEIGERPLFNADRLPKPRDAEALAEEGETGEEEALEVAELNVRLTGVIITPERQYVMFTDRESKEALSAAVGEPIEGRLAGWRVDAVNAREVTFREELNGTTASIELETHKQTLGGSNSGGARRAPSNNAGNDNAAAQAASNQNNAREDTQADEVRRRIADRRARMRAEAARKQAEQRELQEQQQQDGDNRR